MRTAGSFSAFGQHRRIVRVAVYDCRQSSTGKPGTHAKCDVLPVISDRPYCNAVAAIIRSASPRGCPPRRATTQRSAARSRTSSEMESRVGQASFERRIGNLGEDIEVFLFSLFCVQIVQIAPGHGLCKID